MLLVIVPDLLEVASFGVAALPPSSTVTVKL
jgi:hypothetical protein